MYFLFIEINKTDCLIKYKQANIFKRTDEFQVKYNIKMKVFTK